MYYVRAVGINRFTGDGSDKWLRIRGIERNKNDIYTIRVKIGNKDKYVYVDPSVDIRNLRFAKGWPGLMPVSFRSILNTLRRR
jgi:hypothetical protein